MCDELLRTSVRLGHPGGQQRQRAVRLTDDEVLNASVELRTDDYDRLAAARMKRIEDPNLECRTAGSMALLRPASVRPGTRSRSPSRPRQGAAPTSSASEMTVPG